jgi:transcriptional regulator NrdR family protein
VTDNGKISAVSTGKKTKCGCHERPRVIDSRKQAEHTRRRYLCPQCGARWTTIEMVVAETETGCDTKALLSDQLGKKINDDRLERIKQLAEQIMELMPNAVREPSRTHDTQQPET